MAYYFTTILGIIPTPPPGDAKTAGPPIITNPRVLMEHQLMDLKIVTYRADLVDGRRVFRTDEKYLERMRHDAGGYFIELMKVKYYWSAQDPVTDQDAFFHEWGPL